MNKKRFNRWNVVGATDEERFWGKVDKRESRVCWEWKAAISHGYGVFRSDGKNVRAHRYSYELHHGPIPEGLFVCHHCDNPACVNPRHLFLGSNLDNVTDAMNKGRMSKPPYIGRGEKHPLAKLTAESVKKIRKLRTSGVSQSKVAKRFGVHKSTIKDIDAGRTWSHVV